MSAAAGSVTAQEWVPDVERLTGWLAAVIPGFRGPIHIERMSGGQSNPTFRLSSPEIDLVLRSKPTGATLPSAHAVDREFRVLEALQATDVPVPRVRGLSVSYTHLTLPTNREV